MLKVLVAISQKFYCRKRGMGYAKVIHKKRKKKRVLKTGQVSKILKTMGTQMLTWKKEKKKKEKKEKVNKIAHVFLQSCFQVSKERCFQGAK